MSLALSLAACVGAEAPGEAPAATTASVIGGVDSPPERDAVVFLRVAQSAATWNDCSGTLVSPSVIVTARHCVTRVQPGPFMCRGNGELQQDGTGAGVFGTDVDPSSVEVHVGQVPDDAIAARAAAIFTTGSESACRDDMAAVVLDRPIELSEYAPIRASRPTLVGEKLRLVGYGPGERQGVIERREVSGARVVDVAAEDASADDERATTPRRSLVVAGNTLCSGDSGGPALSMESGALVGVYSRVTGDCFAVESRNTFMLASGYTSLLDEAFAAAGETPQRELEEPAAGGAANEPTAGTAGTDAAGGAPSESGAGGVASEPSGPPRTTTSGAFRCSFGAPQRSSRGALGALALLAALALSRRSRRRDACADG